MLSSFFDAKLVPKHDPQDDNLGTLPFVLGENDRVGDCGPVAVANSLIAATGGRVVPTNAQIIEFYSYVSDYDPSQTDPETGENPTDVGVDMQDMMEKLMKVGIAGRKPVAFAKIDDLSDDFVEATINSFNGAELGVDLEVEQQNQTDEVPPEWDYVKSADWGGHAIHAGRYDSATGRITVISWQLKVSTTAAFRAHQLEEAWIIIWEELLDVPGLDLHALSTMFTDLTGKSFPVPVDPVPPPTPPEPTPPAPDPTPTPVPAGCFLVGPLSARSQRRLVRHAKARGFGSVEDYLTFVAKYVV